jgi:hypothetical protein
VRDIFTSKIFVRELFGEIFRGRVGSVKSAIGAMSYDRRGLPVPEERKGGDRNQAREETYLDFVPQLPQGFADPARDSVGQIVTKSGPNPTDLNSPKHVAAKYVACGVLALGQRGFGSLQQDGGTPL